MSCALLLPLHVRGASEQLSMYTARVKFYRPLQITLAPSGCVQLIAHIVTGRMHWTQSTLSSLLFHECPFTG
jgi:hypothetical protein